MTGPISSGEGARLPSMLDLVRLSPRPLFPPGGPDLYRQIALLTDLSEGEEVLDVACGMGAGLEYLVDSFGVQGQGVDHDASAVARAEDRAREEGLQTRLQFQHAPSDALPYRDEVFDVAIGELGLTAMSEPEASVRELARVTRTQGRVVLVQPALKAPLEAARRDEVSRHLGIRPLMLVEWKKLLMAEGVGHLHTEDWSSGDGDFRSAVATAFPDFTELFSVPEKLAILRETWRRWGWGGVKVLLLGEGEVHRLVRDPRLLGLNLITGTRGGRPGAGGRAEKEEDSEDGLPPGRTEGEDE